MNDLCKSRYLGNAQLPLPPEYGDAVLNGIQCFKVRYMLYDSPNVVPSSADNIQVAPHGPVVAG